MNVQKFCHNCGKQLNPGAKFCGECGTNLSSLANTVPPAVKQPAQAQFTPFAANRGDDDDDSYLDNLAHAPVQQNQLHVEIVKDRALGESVGALISQALSSGPPTLEPARLALDAGQVLAEFRKESSTLRENHSN